MQPTTTTASLWTGRVLSSLFALFMLGASIAPKLLGIPIAEETMVQLGWPAGYAFAIGLLELTCVVLYLVPRTSLLGAVLTMGLLGGAMATQIRVGNPLFSHVLFSVYLGLVMWGGLWLRDPRLRALFPLAGHPNRVAAAVDCRARADAPAACDVSAPTFSSVANAGDGAATGARA